MTGGKVGSNRSVDVILNDGASFENFYWLEGPLPPDQGRRITVTHQNQPQQCSNCFSFTKPKYGISEEYKCPANGNGKACKEMGLERTRMGPYMRGLERFVGYRSLKAKFSRSGTPEQIYEDEEETEVSLQMLYKNPIVERDEKIQSLQKEHQDLKGQLPALQETLMKTKMELAALQKSQTLKATRFRQAASVTEQKVAETIRYDSNFLSNNPHLISLLALFQDRNDFNVDADNDTVEPVFEHEFLKGVGKTIDDIAAKTELLPSEAELLKERLGEVKNQVLESVKKRWIRPGRRDSSASQMSRLSKRDREDDI